ncbi:class F sortase [Paenibacillus sp. CAA11]|nr:class F sortase [Paenibacillus sp. CAA11]
MLLLCSGCSHSSQPQPVKAVEPKTYRAKTIPEPPHLEKLPTSKESTFKGLIPRKISIPSVNINAVTEPVGFLESGMMDVPKATDRVGYLRPAALPGGEGNAVMAGHVDTYTGPAVFYPLKKLHQGDFVYVIDHYGNKAVFIVEAVKYYPTAQAPIEAIFGPTREHRLNLITCAGRYSRSRREHEGRLIVFTKLHSVVMAPKKTDQGELISGQKYP